MISLRAPALGVLVCSTLLSAACGSKTPPKQVRQPISVAVAKVRRADVPYLVEANGVVTPLQSATVATQVDGLVTAVEFREGQDVTKGQVLFRIDPRPYQAAYQQAQAALSRDRASAELAKAQYDRYNQLVSSGVVTREQAETYHATFNSSSAVVQADSAMLATAKFNLDNTTVRAPISGRTGALLVRTGNLVRSGGATSLVVINQIQPIMVRFSVPASELRKILKFGGKGGLPVTVGPSASAAGPQTFDTLGKSGTADFSTSAKAVPLNPPGTAASDKGGRGSGARTAAVAPAMNPDLSLGTLSFIDNAVDTTTGTVQLKATFDNHSGNLWVGQFVSSSLRLYVEEGALIIPSQSVVTGQRGTYVYVIDSTNTARERPVVVERTTHGVSIITTGVNEGERVVTDGQSRLNPGATVDIRAANDSGGNGGGRRGGQSKGADSGNVNAATGGAASRKP
jgi:multidrug efflux system membrane fusion protein